MSELSPALQDFIKNEQIFTGEDYVLTGEPDSDIVVKLNAINTGFKSMPEAVFTPEFCVKYYRPALAPTNVYDKPEFQPYKDGCTTTDLELGGDSFFEGSRK